MKLKFTKSFVIKFRNDNTALESIFTKKPNPYKASRKFSKVESRQVIGIHLPR